MRPLETIFTFQYTLPSPSQIQHYFCDATAHPETSLCRPVSQRDGHLCGHCGMASGCFLLIVLSFVSIVCSILGFRTSEERRPFRPVPPTVSRPIQHSPSCRSPQNLLPGTALHCSGLLVLLPSHLQQLLGECKE
ncbi:Olfactory receptor 10G7 [Plecturocebus cupreus]